MQLRSAFLFASAVFVTAGVAAPAAAQESVQERNAVRAEVPWYERFTYSQGAPETLSGVGPQDRRGVQAWQPTTRWGVTVNLREAARTPVVPVPGDRETAVGAYYQFTPSVRVGGQVSVGVSQDPVAPTN
ncbi:MAG: NtrZ family periplasmic regulatory protein, partial [Hyphomonadaceae bacterium]